MITIIIIIKSFVTAEVFVSSFVLVVVIVVGVDVVTFTGYIVPFCLYRSLLFTSTKH